VPTEQLLVEQSLLLQALADRVRKGPSEPVNEPCGLKDDARTRWGSLFALPRHSRLRRRVGL
jgi:hypothetical protein